MSTTEETLLLMRGIHQLGQSMTTLEELERYLTLQECLNIVLWKTVGNRELDLVTRAK